MNNPYVPVDHVIDGVYISGWRATHFAGKLRAAGIVNVLKLYEDIPFFPADFNVFENTLDDGELIPPHVLDRGTQFVYEQAENGRPVLVMCGAGISRSSTFVLSYLLKKQYDLRDAFVLLKQSHPVAQPHPQLWQSLINRYQLPYRLDEVMHWGI